MGHDFQKPCSLVLTIVHANKETIFVKSQYQPDSRLGLHFSPSSAAWGGGGADPPCHIGKQEAGTYIYSLLHTNTGLLGLFPSWSFTVVNVVEKPVTWAV
jgi:hypothetical protein